MEIPWDFENKRLVDLIHNRQGQIIDKKKVPSDRSNAKIAWKFRVVPDTDLFSSPTQYGKLTMGVDISYWTEKIPDNGWFKRENESDAQATPELEIVIHENEKGERHLLDDVIERRDKSIAELEDRADEQASQGLLQKAKNQSNRGSDGVLSAKEEPSRKRGRGRSKKKDDDNNGKSKKKNRGRNRRG